jgi:nitrous oxidase accessory protein NosD
MNTRTIASIFGSALLVAILASGASAQIQRTFVSGLGIDSNPCNRTAPCRTFGQAISQTNPGGEVIALDSAGYGAFTITKAVSIIAAPGVYAGITVFSGEGIDINAGASDAVTLRGLTVNNQGSAGNGVVFNSGGTLRVEDCVITGFPSGVGLFFGAAGKLVAKDCVLKGNDIGITVQAASGTALAAIDRVLLEGNSFQGLIAGDRSKVTVRNSAASANGGGFFATTASAAASELNIENCLASNNSGAGAGAQSTSTGVVTVRVSNSIITDNNFGLYNAGSPAVLLSRANNTVEGNASDLSGTIGSYTSK